MEPFIGFDNMRNDKPLRFVLTFGSKEFFKQ